MDPTLTTDRASFPNTDIMLPDIIQAVDSQKVTAQLEMIDTPSYGAGDKMVLLSAVLRFLWEMMTGFGDNENVSHLLRSPILDNIERG